jgi:hypothetical protein
LAMLEGKNFQRVAASIYSTVVFTENEKRRKKIFHRYLENFTLLGSIDL